MYRRAYPKIVPSKGPGGRAHIACALIVPTTVRSSSAAGRLSHIRYCMGAPESALELILRSPHRVVVAGRTDAGVHAEAQTVHCDLTEADWDRLKDVPGMTTRPPRWHAACRVLCGVASTTRRNTSAFETWPVFCRGDSGALGKRGAFEFDARFSATAAATYCIADGALTVVNPAPHLHLGCYRAAGL